MGNWYTSYGWMTNLPEGFAEDVIKAERANAELDFESTSAKASLTGLPAVKLAQVEVTGCSGGLFAKDMLKGKRQSMGLIIGEVDNGQCSDMLSEDGIIEVLRRTAGEGGKVIWLKRLGKVGSVDNE